MRKNSIILGNNKTQNNISNNEILDNNNLGSSVENNNSQDSVSNSNNPDLVLEQIGINTQIEQNSSNIIRVKKRSLSQASDSSHINSKQKGLNEEFNNQNDIQEESSNQNDIQGIVPNLQDLINDRQKEINKLIDETWETIIEIENKKEIMEDSVLPIPEHDIAGIMIRVREKIDTLFNDNTIAYDNTFDTILGLNPNNPDSNTEVRINIFRDAENIVNPTRLPNTELNFGVIRNIEYTEELLNETLEDININSINLMRVDYPELYMQYPEHPNDHVLTVDSTDDENSGIDPEVSDDYDIKSEHSDDIESEHSDNENIGMVDLFTDKSLEEIEFSDNLRLDRFEYDNYLVLMQGVDNLNYRTVFEDIKEYLDYVNILKDKQIVMLRNLDLIDINIYHRVTHEIFEALLYIAQFN